LKDLYLRPRKLGGRIDRGNHWSKRPFFLYAAIAIVCAAATAFAAPHIFRLPVTVSLNGQTISVPYGTTFMEAARDHMDTGDLYGRLLAVDDSTIDEQGGAPPDFLVRDRSRNPESAIRRSLDIAVVRGVDKVEDTVTEEVEVTPELIRTGSGPFRHVTVSGRVGLTERTLGELSGIELSTRQLVEPRPVEIELSRVPQSSEASSYIALTFDDGPHPEFTPALLDVLREENARATFFLLGVQVEQHPDLVRRIVEEGHQIANHSYSHRDHRELSFEEQREDFLKAQDLIEEASGIRPTWVRPPYGMATASTYSLYGQEDMMVAHWSIDPVDWRRPGTEVIRTRVVERAYPGAVVLLHDAGGNRNQTVAATRGIIRDLREKDYSFLTVEQLYEHSATLRR